MNERILLVDDDPAVRDGLAECLRRAGYDCSDAACIRDAQSILAGRRIDAVILDLVLGAENGMELLRRIRSADPDLPVILITGYASVQSAVEAMHLRASDYLHKPCDPEVLLQQLRAALSQREASEKRREDRRIRALLRLAEGVRHYFNNQLTGIIGRSLLLEARNDLPPDVREAMGQVAAAGKRISEVMDKLDFYREHPGSRRRMALLPLIEETARACEKRIGVTVRVEVEAEVRLAALDCRRAEIGHLLNELIANACEASPVGGKVAVSARVAGEGTNPATRRTAAPAECLICVRDEGAGFAPAALAHLYEPFFTTKASPASGLGLSAARGIALAYGGSLSVENLQSGGAQATLQLPVILSEPAASAPQTSAPATPVIVHSALVVDDEADVRAVVGGMLRACGIHPLLASDAETAKTIAADPAKSFDLVLLDACVAGCLDVHHRVRELMPEIPVILMSGSPAGEQIETFLAKDSATVFLAKPFNIEQFRKALATIACAKVTAEAG